VVHLGCEHVLVSEDEGGHGVDVRRAIGVVDQRGKETFDISLREFLVHERVFAMGQHEVLQGVHAYISISISRVSLLQGFVELARVLELGAHVAVHSHQTVVH